MTTYEYAELSANGLLHLRFLSTAGGRWGSFAMADSSGRELTYGRALAGSLALSRSIARRCPDQAMVGIFLPASVGAALANIATLMAGKVPVNLNFTVGADAVAAAISQCDIRTVLTSRAFLAKAKLEPPPGACYLEDLMKDITSAQKLLMLIAGRLLPLRILERMFMRHSGDAESLATVMFSSGSTGSPKGIMLSHRNVLANIAAVSQIYPLRPDDCVMGVLPLFHSFGFTGTCWLPLIAGCGVVYHPNPLDAGTIGELTQKYKATMIISTPSFCLGYVRKCRPEQFASLRYAVVGAEKLREPIARMFREKYGVELMEGYGCTETAPVIAANAPDLRGERRSQPGTVGRPLPGISAQIVDRDTFEPLPAGSEGLLLVKGRNVMMGYLHDPERTRQVLRDGWYVTGDIATIDTEGFIRLTDRLSRFSKIAGEMVPHLKIEEAISDILGESSTCVVTAIPDETKGERLVALYTSTGTPPESLWSRLCDSSLPKIWIPKRDSLYPVETIPLLGTGKVDLRAVKGLALELTGRLEKPSAS
jgi:acyl-[acyl-carrier-protein]-phospholipid O-acyltransferase/long-chain-fatty-acid--[acyl-carrier-protein] ligase